MSTHTPEPYIAQGHIVRQYAGEDVGGRIIADCGPHHTPIDEYPQGCLREDEANAKRIADCVNACAGIGNPSEAIERAKDALYNIAQQLDGSAEVQAALREIANDALAQLKGGEA